MRTTSASEFSAAITDLTNFDFGPAAANTDSQIAGPPEQGRDELPGSLGPAPLNHLDHASFADAPMVHDELSGDGTSLDPALSADGIAQFATSTDGVWFTNEPGHF